jgi:O-antigen ligase
MERIEIVSLSPRERILNGLVFACLSLVLVMPGGPMLLALCLAGIGLWSFRDLRTDWAQVWESPAVRIMALGFAIFVGVGIFLGVWYDYRPGHYEAFIPFLWAPLMLQGVIKARLQPVVLWTGSATAAVAAGLYASYQSLVLLTGRAMGSMNHPIIFGDLSVVLACIALFGVLYFEQAKNQIWMRLYLLFGAAMGVWGSLLSGSKGGWLSIIMVLLVFVWRVTAGKPVIWRFLGVVLISVLVAKGVWLAPEELVRERLEGVWSKAHLWFETGQVTDWSVSIRLELWSYALKLFAQRPILGWSGEGALSMLGEHLKPFNVPAGIAPVFENDLLHYAAVSGLVGVLSVLALYGGVFACFWLYQKQGPKTFAYALLGMLLVALYFEFGLTVNALGRNAFRYFFCAMTVMLLGLIILATKETKVSAWK